MASRPDFTTKNVVKDSNMMDAFQEGVTEGVENRQSITVYDITVFFEGTKLNERRFEDKDLAMKFAIDNLEMAGQAVTIQVNWVPANYVSGGTIPTASPELPAGDDEIVDAEVVEG